MGWKNLKKKFKNITLKKKLLLFYGILFLLPLFLISILIYSEVSRSMLEKVRYSAVQSYEQAKSYLEYKILMLIQRTDVVVTNQPLTELIGQGNVNNADIHMQLAQRESIRSYLQSVEGSTQSIRLKIYVDDDFIFSNDGDYIFSLKAADEALWYENKGTQKVYFAPSTYLEEKYQSKTISLIRDISDPANYNVRNGVLRMDIGMENLEDILINAAPTENAVTYLINRQNIIVAASNQEKLSQLGLSGTLPEEFKYHKYSNQSGWQESRLEGEKVFFLRDKIRNTDWEMITIIPQTDMVSGIARLQYMVAGLMILFAILTIIGGAVIISWIVNRLSLLVASFNKVKSGNLDAYLVNDSNDEIGVLYDNYNEMIERTSDLMDEKYKMGLSLKNAELKALQSQINPHFLYNTLEMVNWLAYAGRTEEIHKAVISLSKYYRLILNKGKDTLTLGEELAHVGYYMKIQDIRYPGKLLFEQEVEEGITGCMVPKIILQPLVENAISHGIWEKESKQGCIRIIGYQESPELACIKVIDDGVGMSAETMEHMMDGTIQTSGSSYGVKNVHARIQLMYGEIYGIAYESAQGKGTCATIRFPIRQ